MHTRQAGAAHVNIFFFLIMFILFLGALGFAYVTLEKNNELQKEIRTAQSERSSAQNDLQVYRHYVADISAEIGEVGEYKGREGHNYTDSTGETVTPTAIPSASLPKRVNSVMSDFASQIGVSQTTGLAAMLGYIKTEVDKGRDIAKTLQADQTGLNERLTALQTSLDTAVTEHKTRESALNSQLTQQTDAHRTEIARASSQVEAANSRNGELTQRMSDAAESHVATLSNVNKQKADIAAQNSHFKNKLAMAQPAEGTDGKVIESSQLSRLAWIDIGRNDMLPVGTTFEILDSEDAIKGYGTVRSVETNRAEIRVHDLADKFKPVVRGDRIRNDLYSRNNPRNIVLMGRFGHPYSRPVVKELLRGLGHKVVDEVQVGVDLVILGSDTVNEESSGFAPITDSEGYKEAQKLSIEIAPLAKLKPFLRLSASN